MIHIILDILTVLALLFGLFFMFIGALGLWRLPDFYNRMHAATKCITLGISGMLIGTVVHLANVRPAAIEPHSGVAAKTQAGTSAVGAITKAILVIIFQVVAAPVGAHMLSRAAHLDRAAQWEGTLSDELAEDSAGGGV